MTEGEGLAMTAEIKEVGMDDGRVMMNVEVGLIEPNPEQPRGVFDQAELEELAGSIREHGVILPVALEEREGGGFWLEDGERRWRAAILAGLKMIPAVISPSRNGTGQRARLERALVANLQRAGMNAIEEARAFARLRDEFGLSVREIAKRLGKGGGAGEKLVFDRLVWLELEEEIQELVRMGELQKTADVARALLTVPAGVVRVRLAQELALQGATIGGCVSACGRVVQQLRDAEAVLATVEAGELRKWGEVEKEVLERETPALVFAGRRNGRPVKMTGWNALMQLGEVPEWGVVAQQARVTCGECALRDIASESVCRDCGLVDFLRRVMLSAERLD